ncbi:carboxymuconolactone decarboxylase family protein [Halobacillus yeomjeoni]|uniref:Carboxymuconolactone decarboxylase family protein n=1 Tax=Halobacillus yeomjeoni TaxID=311194 RepID=A0A931HTE2_9BACI|nr:carboxymuconolactone decarboxylase family protein [Halobacillus yeomjeoni]MBH0229415.1 carboxymuconolactone decarboxylase family protein [Halobacillus yeomjeoni]MCA0983180.1 carboxymuconolactone decarboxylase family protein [Halobacillus yeomjeoni]
MTTDRYQKGLDKLNEFTLSSDDGVSTHHKISEELGEIAPDIGKYIIEFAYGDIYSRPGLDNKQRALVTLSSLITQGREPQIELHVNTALTSGLTPTEIVESILHLIPYTGFPSVLNALKVTKKVFEQREVEMPGAMEKVMAG